jgi:hypothetical protein
MSAPRSTNALGLSSAFGSTCQRIVHLPSSAIRDVGRPKRAAVIDGVTLAGKEDPADARLRRCPRSTA